MATCSGPFLADVDIERIAQRFAELVNAAAPPRLLNVTQTAQALGISERSVSDETTAGRLRCVRYKRRVLIPVDALNEWVQAHQEAS